MKFIIIAASLLISTNSLNTPGTFVVDFEYNIENTYDGSSFVINEYTNNNFDVLVDDTTRQNIAVENIFLSVEPKELPDDLKFAVTQCKQTNGEDNEIIMINPGATTNRGCEMPEIGLNGTYDGFRKFNFQHILFLAAPTGSKDYAIYTLECTVEVCERKDANSLCNRAAAVCMKESMRETDSADEVAEKSRLMKDWMCDGLCGGVGQEGQCLVDGGVVSCGGRKDEL